MKLITVLVAVAIGFLVTWALLMLSRTASARTRRTILIMWGAVVVGLVIWFHEFFLQWLFFGLGAIAASLRLQRPTAARSNPDRS